MPKFHHGDAAGPVFDYCAPGTVRGVHAPSNEERPFSRIPLFMAWESAPGKPLASAALCRRLLDNARNGGMDLAKRRNILRASPGAVGMATGSERPAATSRNAAAIA